MKKAVLLLALLGLVMFTCSKKNITNNYYYSPEEEGASIVGVVYPPESNATITAYLGVPVASTQIDETGYFKLSGLAEGTYSLLVQAEGYYEETCKASLMEHYTAAVDTIYLAPLGQLIKSVSPGDGTQEVELGVRITIIFKTSMDRESFEGAFHIEPPVEGYFSWDRLHRIVIFNVANPLVSNTRYQVTIDTTACDTTGIRLSQPYEFAFTTGPIKVSSISPTNGQSEVSPYTSLVIRFNTEMDVESVISAFKMVDSDLGVVLGQFAWSSKQSMQFKPNPYLSANEIYTVTIDTTACDIYGGKLSSAFRSAFHTVLFKIENVYPAPNSTNVSALTSIRIYFNADMNTASVKSAFSLVNPRLENIAGEFYWGYENYMEFRPNSALTVSETYTVTLDTTASTAKGIKITEPCVFSFTTASISISSSPRNNDTEVSPGSGINIIFNTNMDTASANSAFRMVDGEQKYVAGDFSWNNQYQMRFTPHSQLALNQRYTVTLNTGASDLYGVKLSEPYEFSFTTQSIRITSSPRNNEIWVSPMSAIALDFNVEMDMLSVNSAFSVLDSDQNSLSGNFKWQNEKYMVFIPNSGFACYKKYTVKVDTSASTVEGIKLSEPYQFSFTTQSLMILSTFPKDKQTWVSRSPYINVQFNAFMDTESVISAFRMTDSNQNEVDGNFYTHDLSYIQFMPSSTLEPSEVYTITIDGSVADLYGSTLGSTFSFWFETAPE